MSETTTVVDNSDTAILVDKYVRLRDRHDLLRKQQQAELAKYTEAMGYLENKLLDVLNTTNAESLRTRAGTVYKSLRTSCKVETWQLTLHYILEHQAYELLEHRVNKTAAGEIVKDTGQPIPGVAITQEVTVNVRRATRETEAAA